MCFLWHVHQHMQTLAQETTVEQFYMQQSQPSTTRLMYTYKDYNSNSAPGTACPQKADCC